MTKGSGFQSFPYPNDVVEFEEGEERSQVKRRDERDLTFVEGDELTHMMAEIASELYDRGEDELGSEMASFLTAALGGK